ncbi:NADP-dependent oxidoreductase [Cumulibacter manganitolerans]|uniref:NADP-dependent oxidoreductase n=1 Tax=Cumulibacter manganitolerans TaxID=1884992 RepID=UPI001294C47C|nr:NADP-dependent oxidoreductase [Cumulibacter manganitolerans]
MNETTRAAGVMEFGGAQNLQLVEVPIEHAGTGQVRVRVHAAAVNPTDTYIPLGSRVRKGETPTFPQVPGMDIAGVIDEVGPGVQTGVQVGDRVMGIVVPSGTHGAYRESIVLPAVSVTLAPAGTSHAEAATLPMNGLTARLALDLLALKPGQTLAVTGAAGAFGGYVIQLAKADGLTVVADSSEADEQLVRDLGADIVVRRGDDVAERFREHFPEGVDALADGAVLDEKALSAVKDDGKVATVRFWKGNGERRLQFFPVMVRDYAENHAALDRLRQQAEDGVVTLRVAKTFPAEQSAEAQQLLAKGGVRGRIILEF